MPVFPGTPVSSLGDGRYVTIAYVKQFIGQQQPSASNPTTYTSQVAGNPDDNILAGFIQVAESDFDEMTGSGFDQQTFTNVQPIQAFVDGNGWLQLFARERAPVTAVSAVQIRDIASGDPTWYSITWDASNDIILPAFYSYDTYPRPESWRVRIWPNPQLLRSATTDILAKWSYTGGFATIPSSLSTLIAEMTDFAYKAGREAILGQMTIQPLGQVTYQPVQYPKTLIAKINRWTAVYG